MEGSKIYIPDNKYIWIPATIIKLDPNKTKITIMYNDEYNPEKKDIYNNEECIKDINYMDNEPFPLQNIETFNNNNNNDIGIEDMCKLSYIHEASILYNIRYRFFLSLPYTYIGDIIIAINPYQWLDMYSDILGKMYLINENRSLQPHIYATSAKAYKNMLQNQLPQSILVSGESGAGKTETVKILMKHLAILSSPSATDITISNSNSNFNYNNNNDNNDCNNSGVSSDSHTATDTDTTNNSNNDNHTEDSNNNNIINKILKSNPLLEAFGNAKTIRNDNSSRFGKFIQLQFNHKGKMIGATCRHYLLEKSRVIHQVSNERNYHIFYQILSTKDKELGFTENIYDHTFKYLGGINHTYTNHNNLTFKLDGLTDKEHFKITCDSLKTIGVSLENQINLFKSLSGILHMGEIKFIERKDIHDGSEIDISSLHYLNITCKMLGIELNKLKLTLCNRTVHISDEMYSIPLDILQSQTNRDALAKEIYSKLFEWLIYNININLSYHLYNNTNHNKYINPNLIHYHIDLLDIFGFESFDLNGFEQFCINFANEKLQQKFTNDVFKIIQFEYKEEGIDWQYIDYIDNQSIVDLFENKIGLISLLNEECVRPKGSDVSFTSKIITIYETNRFIEKINKSKPSEFIIHHYAGSVLYDSIDFVDKNKDLVHIDLIHLLNNSTNQFIQSIFNNQNNQNNNINYISNNIYEETIKLKKNNYLISNFMNETVSSKFKIQLNLLMNDISSTEVHYIRCIKPNNIKSKDLFQMSFILSQLRCAGVVEAIRITCSSFPNKLKHEEFLQRFTILKKKLNHLTLSSNSTITSTIISNNNSNGSNNNTVYYACGKLASLLFQCLNESSDYYVLGKKNIFFRKGKLEELERKRIHIIQENSIIIKNIIIKWYRKRKKLKINLNLIKFQSIIKKRVQYNKYNTLKYNCIRIQKYYKKYYKNKYNNKYNNNSNNIIEINACMKIQKKYKKYIRRKKLINDKRIIILNKERDNKINRLTEQLNKEIKIRQEMENKNKLLVVQIDQLKRNHNITDKMDNNLRDKVDRVDKVDDIDNNNVTEMKNKIETLVNDMNKLQIENNVLKSDNKRVKEAYAAAGASFSALNQHNKQQSKANLRLMSTHAALIKSQEDKMKRYQKQIIDMREELRIQNNVYSNELKLRVQYQNVLKDIIHLAETHHVDIDLIKNMKEMITDTSTTNMNKLNNNITNTNVIISDNSIELTIQKEIIKNKNNTNKKDQEQHDTQLVNNEMDSYNNNNNKGIQDNDNKDYDSNIYTNMNNTLKQFDNSISKSSSEIYNNSNNNTARNSLYYDEDAKQRKSKIGGMFKKIFKKEENL